MSRHGFAVMKSVPTTCSKTTHPLMRCARLHIQRQPLAPRINSTLQQPNFNISTQHRLASTISSQAPQSPTPSASPSTSTPQSKPTTTTQEPPLLWDGFFKLRRRRRLINTASSTVTGVSSFALGTAVLSGQNMENFGFAGVDPMFVMGFMSLGIFFGGWLVGPVLGGGIWRASVVSARRAQYTIKERDFFERIKRFRVDPTSSSVQNPVPDYYGEKIRNVAGYRSWLKDQRAFNKKRQSFV
ncbi:MAG: TIM23 complex component [Chrysothrix sp. TS-e1954]|nr:MAG: TIM23 complex component [Chrysothrix sp. TS-e1954]